MDLRPITCDNVFSALLGVTCHYNRFFNERPVTLIKVRFRQMPGTVGYLEMQLRYYPEHTPDVILINAINFAVERATAHFQTHRVVAQSEPLVMEIEEGDVLQHPAYFSLPPIQRNPMVAWVQSLKIDVFDGARSATATPERRLPGVKCYATTGRYHNSFTQRCRSPLIDSLRVAIKGAFEKLQLAPSVPLDLMNYNTNREFSRDPA